MGLNNSIKYSKVKLNYEFVKYFSIVFFSEWLTSVSSPILTLKIILTINGPLQFSCSGLHYVCAVVNINKQTDYDLQKNYTIATHLAAHWE